MDWIQITVLSLIQGITEFLPISSSGHLVLPAQLTDWPDQGLAFDVGVHFGTLLAVLWYFRMTLTEMAVDFASYPVKRLYTEQIDLALKIAASTIPVIIVGFLFRDFVAAELRTIPVIATTTILFGLVLYWADRNPGSSDNIDWRTALLIGSAQILALVPGTSRSGITITVALLLGLSRTAAARFSFLLAIPTIAGAQFLLTLDVLEEGVGNWGELFSAAALSGITAYFCIHYFIALVERTGMLPYVIYRLLLGTVLFALLLFS
ncbi:MAG: undecaprenyl-diphosphate phosphatase [Pseudomonadales bacterium]|nr:undecaprenyl-diphosphate phosphatase [Pseudomonadales bacterium]